MPGTNPWRAPLSEADYWAGRPGMRVVQALHWLHDVLRDEAERTRLVDVLRRLLDHPSHGEPIRADLRDGLSALPIWMQEFLRPLLAGTLSTQRGTERLLSG